MRKYGPIYIIMLLAVLITGARYGVQFVKIIDGDGTVVAVENQALTTVNHAHADSSTFHFQVDLSAGTARYIMLDLSDTTNWPHDNTTLIHIDWVDIHIDSDNSGDYVVSSIFLDNVDATDGDAYTFHISSGDKTAGNNLDEEMMLKPDGWILLPERIATSTISLNDVNYQTDVNMATLLDPTTTDTPPGTGDYILEALVNAGNIRVIIDGAYHTHSATHP